MRILNPSRTYPVSSPNPKPKSGLGLLPTLGNPKMEKLIKRSLKGQKTKPSWASKQPSVPKTPAVRGIKQYPTDPTFTTPMGTQKIEAKAATPMAKGGMMTKTGYMGGGMSKKMGYAKGGMANCGASMKPNGAARGK